MESFKLFESNIHVTKHRGIQRQEVTEDEFRKLFAHTLVALGSASGDYFPKDVAAAMVTVGEFLVEFDSTGQDDMSILGTFTTVNQFIDG